MPKINIDRTPYTEKPQDIGIIRNAVAAHVDNVTLDELKDIILNGGTFMCSEGGAKADDWKSQQIFGIDIDNKDKITDKRLKKPLTVSEAYVRLAKHEIQPFMVYYTFSSKPDWEHFRILIATDRPVTDRDQCKDFIKRINIGIFPEYYDPNTLDLSRIFFGTTPDKLFDFNGAHVTPLSVLDKLPKIETPKQSPQEPTGTAAKGKMCDLYREHIDEILSFIDPAKHRTDWIKIGAALCNEGFDFEVFHNWSKTAANYESEKSCADVWEWALRTPESKRKATGALLVTIAKSEGWKPPKKAKAQTAEKEPKQTLPPLKGENALNHDSWHFELGNWKHLSDGTIAREKISKTGEITGYEIAAPRKVWIDERIVELTSGTISYRLNWLDEHNQVKNMILPPSVLTSLDMAKLSDHGFYSMDKERTKSFNAYMMDFITLNEGDFYTHVSVNQLGWYTYNHEKYFAPYSGLWFDSQSNSLFNAIKDYTDNGDITPWKDFFKQYRKDRQLRLIMAASLASPLLGFVGDDNNFIVNVNGETGCGKSVALKIAGAMWGKIEYIVNDMNSTANSLFDLPFTFGSLPTILDEFQLIVNTPTYNGDKFTMNLCAEQSKSRLNRDGTPRPTKSHKGVILISAEQHTACNGGGSFNRILNVDIVDRKLFTVKQAAELLSINGFLRKHYGTVGHKFIEILNTADAQSNEIAKIQTRITTKAEEIINAYNTTDKQAKAAALLIVADHIASEFIFEDVESALTIEDIKDILTMDSVINPAERAKELVQGWLAENEPHIAYRGRRAEDIKTGVYGKYDNDKESVFIIKNKIVEMLNEHRFDFDAVKKNWVNDGFLLVQGKERARFENNVQINGIGRVQCLHFSINNQEQEPADDYEGNFDKAATAKSN